MVAAINRVESDFVSLPFVTFDRLKASTTKDARSIFGYEEVEEKIPELSKATRNFLHAGKLLTKHSKIAVPKKRHVYLSQDNKWIIWKVCILLLPLVG